MADRNRAQGRRGALGCEALEGRVVLSDWGLGGGMMGGGGGALLQSLSQVGVVTGGAEFGPGPDFGGAHQGFPGGSNGSSTSQLQTDLQKLQTDLQTIAAKSGVTVADINSLQSDDQAIAQAGFRIDPTALQKVTTELASAVASGASTRQAQTDFNNLFTGSSVSQATITKSFNDMVQAIQDSKITSTDLTTIATDRTAIQTDIANAPGSNYGSETLVASLGQLGILPGGGQGFGGGDFGGRGPGGFGFRGGRHGGDWGGGGSSSSSSQLQTDMQKLQTDLQAIAAKSGVTTADITNLQSDGKAIAQAGAQIDPKSLQTVTTELATAVASSASTSQAQTDFNNLFTGTNVSQATMTKTFNDMVQAIQDSKITSTDLTTIANDRTAIQNDLASLGQSSSTSSTTSSGDSTTTGSGDTSTSSGSTGTGTGSTSTSNGTTTTTTTGHSHHRNVRPVRHHRR
jgi:cell division protein FtsB